jgi:hypothetical protein
MTLLAVFSVLFFVGIVLALAGVGLTIDLLSGRSAVVARVVPLLRILEQKKVRRTQKSRAEKAGVVKMVLLACFVLMALGGVLTAITEHQRTESHLAMAQVPAELQAEHQTVLGLLETLAGGKTSEAMRNFCQNPPMQIYRQSGADAGAAGGLRDMESNAILRTDQVSPIAKIEVLRDTAPPQVMVELANGFRLTWIYSDGRSPGDDGKGNPIRLVGITAPPEPPTRPGQIAPPAQPLQNPNP